MNVNMGAMKLQQKEVLVTASELLIANELIISSSCVLYGSNIRYISSGASVDYTIYYISRVFNVDHQLK